MTRRNPPLIRLLSRFRRDRRGVAAVEFALLAPLLILMLGAAIELGRMWSTYRQFEHAVVGVARHIARYPEYEQRARAYAPAVLTALFPTSDIANFNMKVDSLVRRSSKMNEVFASHVLFGTDTGVAWADHIKVGDYVEEESVIFISASFTYTPLLGDVLPISLTFSKNYPILPFFARTYPWNNGKSSDIYVY